MDDYLRDLLIAAERTGELLEDILIVLRELAVDVDNTARIVDEVGGKLPWIEP